jgi:phage-related protein
VRSIIFYQTESGDSPTEEFLDSLTGKQAQKVLWVLRLIEELERVPSQYFKKLVNTDDIWEVRIQLGNNTFRLLGFFNQSADFVLTNGFAKKSQKTPSQDIAIAEKHKREYQSRKTKP